MVFGRLKDLIRSIRQCKTAADERALIAKESAAIRTAFKEDNNGDYRYGNVAKLLYIHMLGYPAQFGQIECLKLVAGPRFCDKRLGYLGIMLLLDENQEVLTLVTNCLKNDMNHSNMYIVGIALCTLGNISSPETARDLSGEVERLLGSTNAYLRKKASLCAVRILRKVPELYENYLTRCRNLLNERNHAVLLTGITLMTEICAIHPPAIVEFRQQVPALVRLLKNLTTAGFSPEHDVGGITDPFLQVRILRLLRLLGANDTSSSEAMNDILAQVATNTETTKNVGNAILYETVLTILDIQAEAGLRVMAINILGRFLTNKDNNIRYVALHTLAKTVALDSSAVQRHRQTIVDCLRDADISIRRRALELTFALINETTVRALARELLSFLEVADTEFKSALVVHLCQTAERFAPSKRWYIDTVLRTLKLAGNYAKEDNLAHFMQLIAQTPELQAYATSHLFQALKADVSQEGLVHAAVWCIGEFGQVLLQPGLQPGNEAGEDNSPLATFTEEQVIQLLASVLQGPFVSASSKEYLITALMKLSVRFSDSTQRIAPLIAKYRSSLDVELQQRACEYSKLFDYESIRRSVLEVMPPLEQRLTVGGQVTASDQEHEQKSKQSAVGHDLLSELESLGLGAAPAVVNANPTATQKSAVPVDLADLFSSASSAPAVPAAMVAYDKNGLQITFKAQRDPSNSQVVNVDASFTNQSNATYSDLLFQVAVTKAHKLQMQPLSGTTMTPHGGQVTQLFRIADPNQVAIKVRLKIGFVSSLTGPVSDMADFSFGSI